jgi:hypothetical protein
MDAKAPCSFLLIFGKEMQTKLRSRRMGEENS